MTEQPQAYRTNRTGTVLLYEQRSAGSSLAALVLDKKLDILILLFSMSFLLSDKKSQKYTANL